MSTQEKIHSVKTEIRAKESELRQLGQGLDNTLGEAFINKDEGMAMVDSILTGSLELPDSITNKQVQNFAQAKGITGETKEECLENLYENFANKTQQAHPDLEFGSPEHRSEIAQDILNDREFIRDLGPNIIKGKQGLVGADAERSEALKQISNIDPSAFTSYAELSDDILLNETLQSSLEVDLSGEELENECDKIRSDFAER